MANDMIFLGEHVGRSGLPIGVFLVGVPLTCDIAPQFVEGSVEREEIWRQSTAGFRRDVGEFVASKWYLTKNIDTMR